MSVGILKTDEPLPAISKLAAQLKVNADTVQHAYRTLEAEGVVYVKRGMGTFVSTRAAVAPSGKQAGVARQIAERMLREDSAWVSFGRPYISVAGLFYRTQ